VASYLLLGTEAMLMLFAVSLAQFLIITRLIAEKAQNLQKSAIATTFLY
jgi:hypothetical protein